MSTPQLEMSEGFRVSVDHCDSRRYSDNSSHSNTLAHIHSPGAWFPRSPQVRWSQGYWWAKQKEEHFSQQTHLYDLPQPNKWSPLVSSVHYADDLPRCCILMGQTLTNSDLKISIWSSISTASSQNSTSLKPWYLRELRETCQKMEEQRTSLQLSIWQKQIN